MIIKNVQVYTQKNRNLYGGDCGPGDRIAEVHTAVEKETTGAECLEKKLFQKNECSEDEEIVVDGEGAYAIPVSSTCISMAVWVRMSVTGHRGAGKRLAQYEASIGVTLSHRLL